MRGGWLRRWGLVLGCMELAASALAQQPRPTPPPAALTRPVQLTPGRHPLGTVLAELTRQGHLPLSYSSSLVPLGHRYQVRPGPPRPLGEVLGEVLAAEHLAYGLLDGQLVLWPSRVPPPPGITFLNGQAAAAPVASLPAPTSPASQSATGAAPPPDRMASRRPLGAAGIQLGGQVVMQHQPRSAGHDPTGGGSAAKPATRAATAFLATQSGSSPRAIQPGRFAPGTVQRKQLVNAYARKQPVAGHPPETKRATTAAALTQKLPAASQPLGGQATAGPAGQLPVAAPAPLPATASMNVPAAQRVGRQRRFGAGPQLAPRSVSPVLVPVPALPATVAAVSFPTHRPADVPPPVAAPRLRGLSLHAGAWVSESLLLGATAQVGVPRAYLVLGAALADNGRQSGPALGLGLGTAGRARGRFTPSLDALAWRLGADHDREDAAILLAQLRPQLSWQVRRGRRLALVAGPTLNLATAHHRGPQAPRWDFGRDQWLWVNRADDESLLRLWPGVQVGVRF